MTTITAEKGSYFTISMAASDHDDTQIFYTDTIETDDKFGFWAIDNNYDCDGTKLDEADCSGTIYLNPAQVVSVEEFNCDGETETEEEPVEEKPITQKYARRSVDEIPQKKKTGWF